jgi:lysozyme family protein
MLGLDKVQALGRYLRRLRAPIGSGLFAFVDNRVDAGKLRFNEATHVLSDANGPLKSPYAVVRMQCEATRPDWMTLPDLTQAWNRIREAKIGGGDVVAAVKHFGLTATTSPDLTPDDAAKLSKAAEQRFAPEMSGAESSDTNDPGLMLDALEYFVGGGEESAFIGGAPYTAPGQFSRSLEMLLRHEGGYVDHPLDKGGPTNKGVTKAVYDSYRAAKKLEACDVRELTDAELREIYYEGYWRPARCQDMPTEAMAALMFDAAVNHGPKRAIRLLQQGSGVPAAKCDGIWGETTKRFLSAAAANAVGLVDACLLARERFYRDIVRLNPKQAAFIKGWMNRIAGLRGYLAPLLAKAPDGGDTESALFEEGPVDSYLRAADPDFSSLETSSDKVARAAE